ncbi:sugar phosphate isomerase/epimerase [Zobellia galactanivorans]|uniref:D-tagatose 3-epimerase n=1 Tax=Zobellia galactanivorans (strain DSM 12802 / CCUG 47099 / CIP 106680 / NCIMB 13871 / Dsij) TaxID=63186 RepID=G0LA17_ZOBGA|nr:MULTISPECIES: sugar phosphate isomerase/epimerase [Zobellia]MBU3025246.1 sugar phosphate isomerase/epimerase [Zobellia galactanivorans]MDO6811105.1 sugar phosphate isomerase/epimerase [Zobellia galactanivorans]OWW24247.1 xylose isomerase [Zobellia sp. OII3]CAZ94982.1 D-tagatose 3-epimerase [Zobellia galactanivorans]
MKIGMNMLLWTNHVTEQHFGIVDDLKKTGYDGIELFFGEGSEKYYSGLGRHFSSIDMGVTGVASLSAEQNIASPDKKVREAGLERLKWSIDMGEAANAEVLCGPFHSTFALFTRQPPTLDEKKWSNEMLLKAAEYAKGANIILTPEAVNRFECYLYNTMADLGEMVKTVNHPNLGAMFDTHHANIEEKSQSGAIKTIAPHLKHVHISENDRGTPGKGQIDWDDVFSALKEIDYHGWVTIEAFSTAIPEFANAINVWRNYSPVEEVYTEGFKLISQGLGITK